MTSSSVRRVRRGAVTLEYALVGPILFLFLLGGITLGQGVSQYQILAELAREGARYASVHGADYQAAGNTPMTATDIYNSAILPRAGMFAPGSLGLTVTTAPASGYPVGSLVTVTLSYRWTPDAFPDYLPATTLSSTSVMAVSY